MPALRALWKKVENAKKRNQPHDRNLARFEEQLAASVAAKAERAAAAPAISYPADLPVSGEKDRIKELIAVHQVVVLCGETGSGKSTQLPKILMELGYGSDGVIAHTQPRRLAARTLAQRVASELSVPVGGAVGYSVRFEDRTGPETRIRYLTDGLLLAELVRDPDLLACDAVIVDEAHERSLNIDFLLGYLKRLLPRRPDLKLVITSATINTQLFAEHFRDEAGEPAPVIEVSGRTYPVEVRYAPPEAEHEADQRGVGTSAAADRALLDAFDAAVRGTVRRPRAPAMSSSSCRRSGRSATRRSCCGGTRRTARSRVGAWRCFLCMHDSTTPSSNGVLPSGGRPPRRARDERRGVLRHGPADHLGDRHRHRPHLPLLRAARMQRLPIEPVSQASCKQRAGRCGRVAPGVCFRLYSEEDFDDRPAFEAPEVLRTSLASVILTMSAMGLGDPADFPFLEPPRPAAIREGRKTLHELGAAEKDGELTKLGRRMAALPVDPRVARMVFAGETEGCLPEVLVIAAALEVQDPRLRPVDKQQAADQAHQPFVHPRSDFLTLLNLWDGIHTREGEALRRGLQAVVLADLPLVPEGARVVRAAPAAGGHRPRRRAVAEASDARTGTGREAERPDHAGAARGAAVERRAAGRRAGVQGGGRRVG